MTAGSADALLAARSAPGVRLDLAPFRALLTALGNPERRFPAVLVAGTNGKGSTAAMLEAIALAAGLRAGLTTSPHLERVEERIRLEGREIGAAPFASLLAEVFAAAEAHGLGAPTYFEAIVAAAFLAFARAGIDLAVVEVGLGGRLDATNAIDPVLSVVTRIALDHQQYLGDSLAAIAREKAGIFRGGVPALVAAQENPADAALAAEAARLGAPLHRVAREVTPGAAEWRGLAGHRFVLTSAGRRYPLEIGLAGEHQLGNAATALRAAELLGARDARLDAAAIAAGIAGARWPGRLESVRLPGSATTVLLDGAHNPDGCAALGAFLDRLGEPFDLLFGALADKAVGAMLPPLASRARRIVLTRPRSERALAPAALLPGLSPGAPVTAVDAPDAALALALAGAPALLVAAGSLFLVGEIRRLLGERYGATFVV